MKTRFTLSVLALALSLFLSCERDINTSAPSRNSAPVINSSGDENSGRQSNSGVCDPSGYEVRLESNNLVGTSWEWIWSVRNTNPGNGNAGTFQDLSHWGMSLGACFDFSSVMQASYSPNGTNWTNFTPSYRTDPSQGCYTAPVLKFDYGTTGTAKSYYRLIISQDYPTGIIPGYYKSGGNTGCCTFNFQGIGCSTGPAGE